MSEEMNGNKKILEKRMRIRTIRALLKLVDEFKVDSLEVDGVKIVKTRHIIDNPLIIESKATKTNQDDDDLLYYSADE